MTDKKPYVITISMGSFDLKPIVCDSYLQAVGRVNNIFSDGFYIAVHKNQTTVYPAHRINLITIDEQKD